MDFASNFRARAIENLNSKKTLVALVVSNASRTGVRVKDLKMALDISARSADARTGALFHLVGVFAGVFSNIEDNSKLSGIRGYAIEISILESIIVGIKNKVVEVRIPGRVQIQRSFVYWCFKHLVRFLRHHSDLEFHRLLQQAWANFDLLSRRGSKSIVYSQLQFENIGHIILFIAHRLAERRGAFVPKVGFVDGEPSPHNRFLFNAVCKGIMPADTGILLSNDFYLQEPNGEMPIATEDGRMFTESEFASYFIDDYFRHHKEPLVDIEPGTRAKCLAELLGQGIDPGAGIVLLHVRETRRATDPGYHAATELRNAQLTSYAQAVEYLRSKGYSVIRMGDRGMTPSTIPGLFDYPFSVIKSDYMDVFLTSECVLCIGTSSGMSHIPLLFNKKVLYTNWMPFGSYFFSRNSLIITKKLKKNGDYVPFRDSNLNYRNIYDFHFFRMNEIEVEDNTPEEIARAVRELDEQPFVEEHIGSLRPRLASTFKSVLP